MRIGALAEQLGINPRTIRYYEQIRLIPSAPRTSSGYREYDEADAARLTFIKSAQRLGLTLEEVREILSLRDRGEQPCTYVRAVIDEQIAAVGRRIEELRGLRAELRDLRLAAEELPETPATTCRIIEHARAAGGRHRPGAGET